MAEKPNAEMHPDHFNVPAQMESHLTVQLDLVVVLWYAQTMIIVQEMLSVVTVLVTVPNQILGPIVKVGFFTIFTMF